MMRFRHGFSIVALVCLLLTFIFFPISDTAADGPIQTVLGGVGDIWCNGPLPPWWSENPDALSSERGICFQGCFTRITSTSHTFDVTPNVNLTVHIDHLTAGCGPLEFSFEPPEACTLSGMDAWFENYTCIAPDSGQLVIKVVGLGGYRITVTDAADNLSPDAEILAGVQRINQWKAIPYIVYVPTAERAANENAQFIDIWHVDEYGIGQPLLYISKEQLLSLPAHPTENLLIGRTPDGLVNIFKLTTGEYQVNIGPLEDGKVYTTIFDAIPPTTITHSTSVVLPQ